MGTQEWDWFFGLRLLGAAAEKSIIRTGTFDEGQNVPKFVLLFFFFVYLTDQLLNLIISNCVSVLPTHELASQTVSLALI